MDIRDFDILKDFNILYIEDEPDLLKHTASILEDFVGAIFAVNSCNDAFEILKHNQIDVIISDILLKNENGIECIRKSRESLQMNIPAILTTAYTDTEFLLDAIQLKIENYLVKPISIKNLLNTLHDTLRPKIQQREIARTQNVIKTISSIIEGKQVELIRFIFANLDQDSVLHYSYGDIVEATGISKPTIIKLFKQLIEKGIFSKVQNGKYKFNSTMLNKL